MQVIWQEDFCAKPDRRPLKCLSLSRTFLYQSLVLYAIYELYVLEYRRRTEIV